MTDSGGDDAITLVDIAGESLPRLRFAAVSAAEGKVFSTRSGLRFWDAPDLLLRLALRQGELNGWSLPAFDEESYRKKLSWGAASFGDGTSFHRLWFIAGDYAIGTAHLECGWEMRAMACSAALPVVRSFRWRNYEANGS